MKLEDVTMEIRPRSDFEAVDSGFAMARRDFWRCWLLWWMAMLPILALIPLMKTIPIVWVVIFLWWKLTASRMVLYQLSRRLFGENPTWKGLWRELPRAWVRRFFYRMILTRLSPWKPISLVVEELEGLRGANYKSRMSMVMRRGEGMVFLLTLISVVGVAFLAMGLMLTSMMVVSEVIRDSWAELFSWEDELIVPNGFAWVCVSSLAMAAPLVDIFMTGAGFGLYINSRTWVEGWDVELAFKRLANRLSKNLTVLLLGFGLMFVTTKSVRAEEASPREMIEEIKKHDDFIIHKEKYKELKPSSTSSSMPSAPIGGLAQIMGVIGYVLLGALGVGILFLIGWLIYRARSLTGSSSGEKFAAPKARVVMGLEVTSESLPDDILNAAQRLWQQGSRLQALGLLYRGSLSWWITRAGIEIAESDTEGDCLRRVEQVKPQQLGYFSQLTSLWMKGAYATELPQEQQWQELCQQWPFIERRQE
jgi:hypothetical protein